ncbi:hypothetical protein V0U79_04265 [Hyphobacterium sp. HN65]|uniref:Type II secretion system protein GspC N-terminal domain-containing protein n=1 Tax=Hyphobacterium lacteum TaxID=3116575 RepID=A0ABU7LQF1_9PROT|nr:hypothetical protein [Hyphobacterium sp. HN65]MEE2525569.1 hypothetical protein [Hyphobacterium sp. HN65]
MTTRLKIMLGIAAILAVLTVMRNLVWTGDAGVIPPSAPPQNVEIRQETGEFLPPFDAFEAIVDRPLFRPDRRPAPVEIAETAITPEILPSQAGEPDFLVIGVVTGPDGGVATLRSDTETVRAYVGDTIEGWRIDEIDSNGIEVSRGGNRYRLRIGEDDD